MSHVSYSKRSQVYFLKLSAGFTLAEVMVALVVLLGAGVAATTLVSANATRVVKAQLNNTAAILLEKKMTEVLQELQQKSIGELKEEESGDFGKDYPDFHWSYKTRPFEMPDVRAAIVANEKNSSDFVLQMFALLKEHIDKSVVELTVTISTKLGEKPMSYKASTYLIDYSKPLPIPGGAAAGGGGGGGSL